MSFNSKKGHNYWIWFIFFYSNSSIRVKLRTSHELGKIMSQRQDPFANIAYTCKFVIQVLSYTNFKYFWKKKKTPCLEVYNCRMDRGSNSLVHESEEDGVSKWAHHLS